MSLAPGPAHDSFTQVNEPDEVMVRPEDTVSKLPAGLLHVAVFLLCFGVAVVLQMATGAYHAELSGYPDEPAQYVTGLMLDQYIRNLAVNPLQFAESYYAHYPKVAFGHWPPLLYLTQAAWTLVTSPSRESVLVLQAVLAATAALLLWHVVAAWTGALAAIAAALVFLAVPVVQVHTSMVMAEILLTLTMFAAAVVFGKFLETENKRYSLLFGGLALLSILTKGTGWALALIPPVAVLLTGKWRLLRSSALWVGALPVVVLGLPWQLATNKLAAQGWDESSASASFARRAVTGFAAISWEMAGWGIATAALAGIFFTIVLPLIRRRWTRIEPFWAAMFGLLLTSWIFHIAVPAGVEPRKLIIAIPPWLAFAAAGSVEVWKRAPLSLRRPVAGALLAFTVAPFAFGTFSVWHKQSFGFTQAARFLAGDAPQGTGILVSSGSDGEGLLIAELAMLQPQPRHFAIRASKFLARTNWNGSEYFCLVHSPEQIAGMLAKVPVSFVVIDLRDAEASQHTRLLRRTVDGHWPLAASFGTGSGQTGVLVYRNPAGAKRVQEFEVDLGNMLGKSIRVKPD